VSEAGTTCGRDLESSECVDMRHLRRRIIEAWCDRTFAFASQRPALICKTVDAIITENEMVEEPDAQQIPSFPQPCGERPILRARRGISGGMVMGACDVKSC
jgi:hypothetical protein